MNSMTEHDVVEALRHKLDRDRYIVAIALGGIRKALDRHRWLLDGRGPYEWDDDRYRDEFTDWVEAVEQSVGILAKLAWDKDDCTTDTAKVQAAREAAREYVVDAPKGHRSMLPSDLGLPCPSCASLQQTAPAKQEDREGLVGFDLAVKSGEYLNTIDDMERRVDERGRPFLAYTAQHVVNAFKAGAALSLSEAQTPPKADPWEGNPAREGMPDDWGPPKADEGLAGELQRTIKRLDLALAEARRDNRNAFPITTLEADRILTALNRDSKAVELAPNAREAWIRTILSLSGSEANRRAFMAGYNQCDCPKPVTHEKDRAWARGMVAYAYLKESSNAG